MLFNTKHKNVHSKLFPSLDSFSKKMRKIWIWKLCPIP